MNRFRPEYRALTNSEKKLIESIKDVATELEALYEQANAGRYNALAMTSLEQSVMWIVKEITS